MKIELQRFLPFGMRCLVALAAPLLVILSSPAAEAQIELRLNSVESYFPDFPVKRVMNRAYRLELNELLKTIHKRMEAGENLLCSAQIFDEVHWLVNYTDRVEDIERRMEDLRKSMKGGDQAFAGRQDPKDGPLVLVTRAGSGGSSEAWIP